MRKVTCVVVGHAQWAAGASALSAPRPGARRGHAPWSRRRGRARPTRDRRRRDARSPSSPSRTRQRSRPHDHSPRTARSSASRAAWPHRRSRCGGAGRRSSAAAREPPRRSPQRRERGRWPRSFTCEKKTLWTQPWRSPTRPRDSPAAGSFSGMNGRPGGQCPVRGGPCCPGGFLLVAAVPGQGAARAPRAARAPEGGAVGEEPEDESPGTAILPGERR